MLPGTPRTFVGATTLLVRGLTGASTLRLLVDLVTAVPGVASVSIDAGRSTVTVRAEAPVDRADVVRAIADAGVVVVP